MAQTTVASNSTVSDVQSLTSDKPNKHTQTQLYPSSFQATKTTSSDPNTSSSLLDEYSNYSDDLRPKYAS